MGTRAIRGIITALLLWAGAPGAGAQPFKVESLPLVDHHVHLIFTPLDRYMEMLARIGFGRAVLLGPCREVLGSEGRHKGKVFLFTHGIRNFDRWRARDPAYMAEVAKHVAEDLRAGCLGLGEFLTRHRGIPGIGMAPIDVPSDAPEVLRIIDTVASFNRPIFWHFEPPHVDEYERAAAHNPSAKIVWVHEAIGGPGFQRLRRALEKFPNLYLDLAGSGSQTFNRILYPNFPGRPPHLLPDRRTVHPLWRELVEEYAHRIMIPGLDLESAGREGVQRAAEIAADHLHILSQLSECAARKTAHETLERLLGLLATPPVPCKPLDPASVVFPADVFKLDGVVLDRPLPARLRTGQVLTLEGTSSAVGEVRACLFPPGGRDCDYASARAMPVNSRFSLALDLSRVPVGNAALRVTPDFSVLGRAVGVEIVP